MYYISLPGGVRVPKYTAQEKADMAAAVAANDISGEFTTSADGFTTADTYAKNSVIKDFEGYDANPSNNMYTEGYVDPAQHKQEVVDYTADLKDQKIGPGFFATGDYASPKDWQTYGFNSPEAYQAHLDRTNPIDPQSGGKSKKGGSGFDDGNPSAISDQDGNINVAGGQEQILQRPPGGWNVDNPPPGMGPPPPDVGTFPIPGPPDEWTPPPGYPPITPPPPGGTGGPPAGKGGGAGWNAQGTGMYDAFKNPNRPMAGFGQQPPPMGPFPSMGAAPPPPTGGKGGQQQPQQQMMGMAPMPGKGGQQQQQQPPQMNSQEMLMQAMAGMMSADKTGQQ